MSSPAQTAPPRRHSCDLVRSVALSPPAVRFVAVNVVHIGGNTSTFFDPVPAIRTTVVDVYQADDREPRRAPTHEGMIAEGWRYDGREVRDEFLVHTDDHGLSDPRFAFSSMFIACYRVVPCPWPAAQDEERLASVVAELSAEARYKAEEFAASRRQPTSTPTP